MQQTGSFAVHPEVPPRSAAYYIPTRSDFARLMIVGFLLAFFYAGAPTSFFSASSSTSPSFAAGGASRRVLEDYDSPTSSFSLSLLLAWAMSSLAVIGSWIAKIATVLVVILVLYIAALLQDMRRLPKDRLAEATKLIFDLEIAIKSTLPSWRMMQLCHDELMAKLGKPLPTTLLGEMHFFGMQLARVFMHRIGVGAAIERFLVRILDRDEATAVEAAAYMSACIISQPYSLMRVYGSLLASLLASNSTPSKLRAWPIDRPPLFMHMHRVRMQSSFMQNLMHMVLAQLRECVTPESDSLIDWRAVSAVLNLIMDGRVAEAIQTVRDFAPIVDGVVAGKLLATSGMLFFALRRFDEGLIVHSTVFKLGRPPAFAVRFVTFSILYELVALDRLEEARALFIPLEDMFALGDSMTPPDLILLHIAKIVLSVDQSDYAAIAAHAKQVLNTAHLLPLVPIFYLPFAIEMVVERLLPALEPSSVASEDFYVMSHRKEIGVILDQLIDLTVRSTHWPIVTAPMLQRLRGWRAYTLGDRNSASYYLNKSLQDAERVTDGSLVLQQERTLQLMARIGVRVVKKKPSEAKQAGPVEIV